MDIFKKILGHLNPTNEPVMYLVIVLMILQILFGEEVVNHWVDVTVALLTGAVARSQVKPTRKLLG